MSMAKNYSSGNGTVKVEKSSSFVTTCNRLSSFLKSKGSLRDLGINAKFDVIGKQELSSPATKTATTTIDFLSSSVPKTKDNKSMEPLSQYVKFDMFCKQEDSTNKAIDTTKSKTKQMTVFYEGKVLVFDHVSADKAREVMFAASGASSSFNGKVENQIHMASTSNSQCEAFKSQEQIGLDLPIARRASLYKFLANRKDRETERVAPYQLHNPNIAVASSSYTFDLNL